MLEHFEAVKEELKQHHPELELEITSANTFTLKKTDGGIIDPDILTEYKAALVVPEPGGVATHDVTGDFERRAGDGNLYVATFNPVFAARTQNKKSLFNI